MSNTRPTADPAADRDPPRDPATVVSLLDHMRAGLMSQRFRLGLIGVQAPDVIGETADRRDDAVTGVDRPRQDRPARGRTKAARRHAARDSLNARMRPILYALARNAGLDPDVWKARLDAPMPLTDPEIVRALPEVFASDAFRDARAACRDLTLLAPEQRVFAETPFDLGFRGRPPAEVVEHHPCWDLPLVPGARALERWTIADVAEWMKDWPPEPGELKGPIDLWDEPTADLWLRRYRLVQGQETDRRHPVVAYREGRGKKSPLKVLAGLDDDALLVLTDSVLCERLRREVMAVLMQDRADLIHVGLEMVACGYLSVRDVRKALAAHDEAREKAFWDAFAENDDWMYEWIVTWSALLIWRYNFPLVGTHRVAFMGY